MTVTATGFCCLSVSASTRSAICFATVSKSMIVWSLSEMRQAGRISTVAITTQPAQVQSESLLHVSRLLETPLQKRFDSFLCRGSCDGGHARVPAGSDLDVGR